MMFPTNKFSIFITLFFLICAAIFLRFNEQTNVYTEYDDVGVVAINKAHIGIKEIDINLLNFNITLKFNMEQLRDIENTALYPFYIASTWTYAPGQYVFSWLLNDVDDNYETTLIKGRSISAIFSILGILSLLYLMIKINDRINWAIPFFLSFVIFSSNSILYAHHMSPYSLYFFTSSLGLILLYKFIIDEISWPFLVLSMAVLFYFSYMTIIFALPIAATYFYRLWDKRSTNNTNIRIFIDFLYGFLALIITLPLALFVKSDKGMKGVAFPKEGEYFENILVLTDQFFKSFNSLLHGFIDNKFVITAMLIFSVWVFFLRIFKAKFEIFRDKKDFFVMINVLILLEWVFLYIYGFLPLDESRHVLIIFPQILIFIFYFLKNLSLFYDSRINIFFLIVVSLSSFINAQNLISSKSTNLDFDMINKVNLDTILTYRSTLSPLLYYKHSNKKVYFIDMNSFKKNYTELNLPKQMILVSQNSSIYDEGLYTKYKKELPKIFCKYKIETLIERPSKIYFTYNNYGLSSSKNAMFLYVLKKSESNFCS